MEQRERIRTYLVYGDSGCGKSSFISQLKGVSTDNKLPECGGGGEAMTKEPGKVYVVEHEKYGKIQLIDTRGTWDPSAADNNQILQDLVKTMIDFSVGSMQHQVQPQQWLDGIIYVHKCLSYDRYHRDQRMSHLSSLLGVDLMASSMTLMTQYQSLQRLEAREIDKFNAMVKKYHIGMDSSGNEKILHPFVLWDSLNPLETQDDKLFDILFQTLKPFDLTIITKSNETIIEKARELQMNVIDLVETNVTLGRIVKKMIRTVEDREDELPNYERTFTVDCPNTYLKSVVTMFASNLQSVYSPIITVSFTVEPHFPSYASNPRQLISCFVTNIEYQNAEIVGDSQIQLENKGDYFEGKLNYRWKPIQDHSQHGKITLKMKIKTRYRIISQVPHEEWEPYSELQMLPRYCDEKPYLEQAQAWCMQQIYNDIRKQFQTNTTSDPVDLDSKDQALDLEEIEL